MISSRVVVNTCARLKEQINDPPVRLTRLSEALSTEDKNANEKKQPICTPTHPEEGGIYFDGEVCLTSSRYTILMVCSSRMLFHFCVPFSVTVCACVCVCLRRNDYSVIDVTAVEQLTVLVRVTRCCGCLLGDTFAFSCRPHHRRRSEVVSANVELLLIV